MRGTGSIFKRGNVLWMKFYRDGVPVSISCKTSSKEIARSMLRAELRKSDEEFTEPRFKRVTVGELYNLYLDNLEANGKDDYRKNVVGRWNTHLKKHFENMKAAAFDSEAQHKYRKARIAEGAAGATINRELQVIIAAFKLGYDMQPPLVKRLPKFHLTREENARRVFATTEQMAAIKREAANLEHFKDARSAISTLHMRTFVEIAHKFGWRLSEIHGLRVSNIRLIENTIRIEDSKNGDAREVTMTPAIRTLIEALVVGEPADARLFPFNEVTLWTYWNKVVEAAGCPHIHIHDLRRTSARSKRSAGVDVSVTMAIMGWKTDKMFRRYGIVAQDDIAAAMAKQEQYATSLGVN